MDAGTDVKDGYYWFQWRSSHGWDICYVYGGYVLFFGEARSLEVNKDEINEIEFGPRLPNEPYPHSVITYPCAKLDMEGVAPVSDDELTRLRQEFEKAFYGPWRRRLYTTSPGCQIDSIDSFIDKVLKEGTLVADWSPDTKVYQYQDKYYEITFTPKASKIQETDWKP